MKAITYRVECKGLSGWGMFGTCKGLSCRAAVDWANYARDCIGETVRIVRESDDSIMLGPIV